MYDRLKTFMDYYERQIISKVDNVVWVLSGANTNEYTACPIYLTYNQGDNEETKLSTMLEF